MRRRFVLFGAAGLMLCGCGNSIPPNAHLVLRGDNYDHVNLPTVTEGGEFYIYDTSRDELIGVVPAARNSFTVNLPTPRKIDVYFVPDPLIRPDQTATTQP